MTSTSSSDTAAILSAAFRQLSDALYRVSVACKDLEYTIPLLSAGSAASATVIPEASSQPAAEKPKRIRDPNEPRRPPSSYLLFLSKARQDVNKADPDLKPAEVMSKLANMWNDLSESDKKVSFIYSTLHSPTDNF